MIPVVDLHTDLIHSYLEFGDDKLFREVRKQMTFNSLRESQVKIFFAAFSGDDEYKNTPKQIEVYKKLFTKNNIGEINCKEDLITFPKKLMGLLHIEGGDLIKNEDDFEMFYSKGVRSLGLVYEGRNSLGCGSSMEDNDFGLTKLGKMAIKLANKNGVIIDLAHTSERSFKDSISVSSMPVLVTHTACRRILNNPRNISDLQIKTIAQNNGLIGIFFSKKFISDKENVDINAVLRHFNHVANLVGTKYLAIGSDFAGISKGAPVGLENCTKLNSFLLKMREFGFSKSEVEDIAYRNAIGFLKRSLRNKAKQ